MAAVTLYNPTGTTLTGTFNSLVSGGGAVGKPGAPYIVFTTCTCTDGTTLTDHPTWKLFVDPITATTCNVPVAMIKSVA